MMNCNYVNNSRCLARVCEMILRPLTQFPATSAIVVFFFLSLLVGAFFSTHSRNFSPIEGSVQQTIFTVSNNTTAETAKKAHRKIGIPLKCSNDNITQTCPADYPETIELDPDAPPPPTCLEYFRWIYEDLRPWEKNGITREMVEGAKPTANFRLIISNGKAYVEKYHEYWQKDRDIFTLWGILQLLRRYPGRVPDLELMFDCNDYPRIIKNHRWPFSIAAPPPLFRYCGDDKTWDIVFPDWSFWGW